MGEDMSRKKISGEPDGLFRRLRELFPFCWRDLGICLGLLVLAAGLCYLLRLFDTSDVYVALIFELAVVLVSRFTTGYLFGVLASVIGVIGINYIFTYPYYAFNFTLSGYPLTFVVMLAVSVTVGTMTTQIKQQEKLRAEVEKEKMRGNLLRAVSHDIRTPLTSIVGGIDTVLDSGENLPPALRTELLQNIREESRWLVGVVENLLSVTRVSGGAAVKKQLEAGEEVMSSAAMKLGRQYPQMQISVRAPEELLLIPMDVILIEQVLINLMENAIQHGGTTSRIELHLRRERGWALFEVADNGQGIAKEAFAHLFDGYLAHTAAGSSDSKRNMGIGLSVCLSIVQAHGGMMEAENRALGGAVFRFKLPLEEKKNDD